MKFNELKALCDLLIVFDPIPPGLESVKEVAVEVVNKESCQFGLNNWIETLHASIPNKYPTLTYDELFEKLGDSCKNWSDAIALYQYYSHIGEWEKVEVTMSNLRWGEYRITNARKILQKAGLMPFRRYQRGIK